MVYSVPARHRSSVGALLDGSFLEPSNGGLPPCSPPFAFSDSALLFPDLGRVAAGNASAFPPITGEADLGLTSSQGWEEVDSKSPRFPGAFGSAKLSVKSPPIWEDFLWILLFPRSGKKQL